MSANSSNIWSCSSVLLLFALPNTLAMTTDLCGYGDKWRTRAGLFMGWIDSRDRHRFATHCLTTKGGEEWHPGVFCVIPPQTTPCTIALAPVPSPRKCVQSHFHPFPLSPPWYSSSVLRNFVTCCLVSDRIFGSTFCSPYRPWQASSHGSTGSVLSLKTHKFFGLSLRLSYQAAHTNSLACLLSMTSQPPPEAEGVQVDEKPRWNV